MGVTGVWRNNKWVREWKKIHTANHTVSQSSLRYMLFEFTSAKLTYFVFLLYLFIYLLVSWQLTLHCLCPWVTFNAAYCFKWKEKKFYPDDTRFSDVGNRECYKDSSVPHGLVDMTQAEKGRWCLVVTGLPALGFDSTTATVRKKMSTYNKRVGTICLLLLLSWDESFPLFAVTLLAFVMKQTALAGGQQGDLRHMPTWDMLSNHLTNKNH